MFDFHADLFARVLYEIGRYYCESAAISARSNMHIAALNSLYTAQKLILRANYLFQRQFHFPISDIQNLIVEQQTQLASESNECLSIECTE